MFHIVLCDDDRDFISYMEKMINKVLFDMEEAVFHEYASGKEMMDSLKEDSECDLLILDMQMPEMDGDDTAKLFRKKFADAVLVFCSGAVSPTTKSFEAEPYRYLMKSSSDEEMLEKLKDIIKKVAYKRAHSYITINDKTAKYVLKVRDIAYVEIIKRGCEINFNKVQNRERTKLKVNKNMAEMRELLKEYRFASPHKSFLVNFEHILNIGSTTLELSDGTTLAISKYKVKAFRQSYLKCETID